MTSQTFEYNPWLLKPKDDNEERLFKQFRNKDVTDLFKYIVFAVGLIVVAMIFNFLRTQELAQAIVCTDGVISFLFHLVLWVFRGRVQEKFSICVTAITILTTF